MGLVTDQLLERLAKQVEQAGTVVWYDPERDYAALVETLTPERLGSKYLQKYSAESGFLVLRKDLEPIWGNTDRPPRLVLYVPMARPDSQHALIEYEVGGTVMRPGQQPPEQDTALAAVAQAALSQLLPPAAVAKLVEQVNNRQLTLEELDRVAEKGVEAQTGALAMIFDSGNGQEIGLHFLVDESVDDEIVERQSNGALRQLLEDSLGVKLAGNTPAELRAGLARHVLMTDYLVSLGERAPEAYSSFPLVDQEIARQAAVKLASAWRNQRDASESYVRWSDKVAEEMAIANNDLPLEALRQTETFLASELQTLALVEDALQQRASQRIRDLIQRRIRRGFWSGQQPDVKKHWEVVDSAAGVLAEANRIESTLKGKQWNAGSLLSSYALSDSPWCQLDRAQRHLERDFHQFDPDHERHDGLLKLVAHARQQYSQVAGELAERFIKAYADAHFEIDGVLAQADVYAEFVASGKERTAYLLVDGLRYEMALELQELVDDRLSTELHFALATPPTVTEIGMAALMPGAEGGITIEAGPGGKLEPIVDGTTLKVRNDRIAHFTAKVDGKVVETTADMLAPLSDRKLRKRLAEEDLVLVTATDEIDGLWEQKPSMARRMMDDAINQLRRVINTLSGLGVRNIIVTADHGYLFGERISTGDSIEAPGGQTALLKRRVWVGKGGSSLPGVLRRPLSTFGIGGDLELATPVGLGCFKSPGGSMEYFHGGLSLPELVIPVLALKSPEQPQPEKMGEPSWQIVLGSDTISTRFASVTVNGESGGLLAVTPQKVRVEIRAGDAVISTSVSATYGFNNASKDTEMAPDKDAPQRYLANTITLMITDEPVTQTVSVQLKDAETGRTLASKDSVPVNISI